MNTDQIKFIRRQPITAAKMHGVNLLNAFIDRLLMYQPKDLRIDEDQIDIDDNDFIVDMVEASRVVIKEKRFAQDIVTTSVKYVTNLDEIKTYNEAVKDFNDQEFGDTEDRIIAEQMLNKDRAFDYATGDPRRITKPISLVIPFKQTEEYSDEEVYAPGAFGKNRPTPIYATRVTVQYHVTLVGKIFTVGYVARDTQGRVLYYDEASDIDLTQLIRRSVQRLWGNHHIDVTVQSGEYYEGVTQLIQGRKTRYCKNNPKPDILRAGERMYTVNTDVPLATAAETASLGLGRVFGYIVPVLGVLAVILFLIWGINQYDLDSGAFAEGTMGKFLTGLAVITAVLIILSKIPKHLYKKADHINLRKKFM